MIDLIRVVVFGVLICIFVYIAVRGASWAYFRTRLEYLRSSVKELRKEMRKGEDNNGL